MQFVLASVILGSLFACGRGEPEKKGPVLVPGTPVAAPGAVPSAPPAPAGSEHVALPTIDIPPTPAPIVSTEPDSCEPCSLLMEFDYDDLKEGRACELCGDKTAACEGWPEPGTPSCDQLDWLRNCLYARLGYDFETAEDWRVVFDQEPWYTADPDFSWDRVNAVQKRNATQLRNLVKRRRCAR